MINVKVINVKKFFKLFILSIVIFALVFFVYSFRKNMTSDLVYINSSFSERIQNSPILASLSSTEIIGKTLPLIQ